MPAAAWIDERHLAPLGLTNYWGYNPVALLAPDPRLAPGGMAEVRDAVAALQAAGFAVLQDVVFNHNGEGDQLGPTLSLKGLGNAHWFRLKPEDRRRYRDDSGCGNTLALDRVWPLRLVMATFRLLDTASLSVDLGRGAAPVPFRRLDTPLLDAAPARFTGDVSLRGLGWRRDTIRPLWRIEGDTPLPMTLLSVTTETRMTD